MKLSKQTIQELREFLDRGCEYSGTQEILNDTVTDILNNLGSELISADEIGLTDGSVEVAVLQDFVDELWDRIVPMFLNVLETQEIEVYEDAK